MHFNDPTHKTELSAPKFRLMKKILVKWYVRPICNGSI